MNHPKVSLNVAMYPLIVEFVVKGVQVMERKVGK